MRLMKKVRYQWERSERRKWWSVKDTKAMLDVRNHFSVLRLSEKGSVTTNGTAKCVKE
jgi:hypothetical protein